MGIRTPILYDACEAVWREKHRGEFPRGDVVITKRRSKFERSVFLQDRHEERGSRGLQEDGVVVPTDDTERQPPCSGHGPAV